MAYNEPSTPFLQPPATITSNGIKMSVPKKDSATPSNRTIQKYGNIFNTTKSCASLHMYVPINPINMMDAGFLFVKNRLNVMVANKKDSDPLTVIHANCFGV